MVKLNKGVKERKMKKENDTILVSLVMIIVILIILQSICINLISANNIVIKKTNQIEEVNIEQIKK